jgi:hypothetical protein
MNCRDLRVSLKHDLFAIAVTALLSLCIFWLMGGSLETLTHGKWADLDDHPTNYLDTDLHPSW